MSVVAMSAFVENIRELSINCGENMGILAKLMAPIKDEINTIIDDVINGVPNVMPMAIDLPKGERGCIYRYKTIVIRKDMDVDRVNGWIITPGYRKMRAVILTYFYEHASREQKQKYERLRLQLKHYRKLYHRLWFMQEDTRKMWSRDKLVDWELKRHNINGDIDDDVNSDDDAAGTIKSEIEQW